MINLTYFSIKDIFWIQFKEHLITLGFHGLPKNIHLTIAFNDDSADINLHITKQIRENDNPQIGILKIKKILIEQILSKFSQMFLNRNLVPLDIELLKEKHKNNIGFLSFTNVEKSDWHSKLQEQLIDSFKNLKRGKSKTRLRLKNDVQQGIEHFIISQDWQEVFKKSIVNANRKFVKSFEGGILVTANDSIPVIRMYDKWYKIKKDIRPLNFAMSFMDIESFNKLVKHYKRSLVIVRRARTKADTEKYNRSLRFVMKN